MVFHMIQLLPELNEGGVERGVVELNRELVKRGHRSTVISAGGRLVPSIEQDGGTHVLLDICSKNPLTFPSRVRRLRALLQSLRPDVIHARSRVPAWIAWTANKKLRIPFVTTVHGFNSVSRYSSIMVRGDRVVYGSRAVHDFILNHYPVDADRLRYIPRGIDTDYFDPAHADPAWMDAFRQKHGLEGKTVVTAVGRITELKGHDVLIRALATVRKSRPDVVGLIAGGVRPDRQDWFDSLVRLAETLGVRDAICFAGTQSQMREIYALSDLVVSATSSKPETFGRTTAEALAMNRPVVASAHGGSLDLIQDGINGFLFSPGDSDELATKIELALSTPFSGLRERIIEEFSLHRMTLEELALCKELAAPRNPIEP